MVRIGPHTTVASRAEQAASEAMQKPNLSTNFAVNAHDVVLHSLPGFAIDLHCSSLARLRNNSANGKAIRFTVTTSIVSVYIILLLPHGWIRNFCSR